MTNDIIGFHLVTDPHASFSNWDFSPFTYAGYYYTCVEQYMMAQKVFAGHRFDLFEKILRTADPAEMKRLAGKDSFQEYAQICSFWEKNRKHIVKRGVRAKFQQNAEMREELLSTGTALLCECAGQDRVWGVGITYSDPSWQDVSNWNGDNLLGVILMEVREELRISHIPYIGFQDAPSIPEWQLTAKHLKRIPQFYDAIHAYADQLPAGSLRNGFYSVSLEDVEFSMRTNMGGGLPVAGFYEMKQEVYEVARKLEPNPKRYLSELFAEKPKHFGLRGDQFFWADLESMFAFVEAGTLSEEEFIDSIYRLHRKVTGKELLADQDVKVDKYAHGGMSSGKVSGAWWIKEGIPTLVERFVECQNK